MKRFTEAALWILLAVFIFSIMIRGVIWLKQDVQEAAIRRCDELGEQLGFETELISGHCYIKIRPGLKVREDLVLYFLPVIVPR